MDQQNGSKKSSATITTVSSINLVSDIKVRRYDCKWTINNFRLICSHDMDPDADDGSMQSRKFDTDGLEWRLHLFPLNSFNEKHLSVRLYCYDSRLEDFYATISIINNQSEEVSTQQKTFTRKNSTSDGLIFERIVEKSYLFDENNGLMQNHKLTLLCKIFINENVFVKRDAVKFRMNQCRLIELSDFKKLLDDREFSDVRIVVGSRTFHAHRAILSSRSSVFAEIIDQMKKQDESEIEMHNFDEEVIEQLLLFLYSGRVDLDKIQRLAKYLFVVAYNYEIDGLKVICEESLIQNLNIDNIAEVLKFLDSYDSELLYEAALEFLSKRSKELTYSFKRAEDLEVSLSSLSPQFLAKVIRSLMEQF